MIEPATKATTLVKELNNAIRSAHTYVPQDELTFRRYAAEAQKLLKVNAVEGHHVFSVVYSLAGEAEKAIEHIDIALRLTNEPILWCNKAAILSNLGFFSEAQKAFKKGVSPENRLFGEQLMLGLCIGAFQTILEFETVARRMQLDVNAEQLDRVRRIVSLMDEYSIRDADVGAMLDVAGKILRRERLFFLGEGPDIAIWDQDALEEQDAGQLVFGKSQPEELDRRLALLIEAHVGQMSRVPDVHDVSDVTHFDAPEPSGTFATVRFAECPFGRPLLPVRCPPLET